MANILLCGQDSRCSELSPASTELQSLTVLNALTRKAGGRKSEQKEMQVFFLLKYTSR